MTTVIGNNLPPKFTIDDKQFEEFGPLIDPCMPLEATQDRVLENNTTLAHPYHIHINPFQVVKIETPTANADGVSVTYTTTAPAGNRVWQDVVAIPKAVQLANGLIAQGRVTIRQHYADFPGTFVLHCHILAHEDRGMMQLVRIVPSGKFPGDCQQAIPHHHQRLPRRGAFPPRLSYSRAMSGAVQNVQLAFLALLFVAVTVGALAKRLNTPYPILLVIAGLLLGFAPVVPRLTLNPDVIFFVFLPPLLYSGAWNTSWRDFRFTIVNILTLAFGLVAFTVIGVAAFAQWFFAGFDMRSGIVLGAAVATTDAIAATAIARRLGVSRSIVDVIEGESLVNDATGLLALEFGIAMLVHGQSFSAGASFLRLGFLIGAGIAIGLVVGVVVVWLERAIDDGPLEIAISILVPYASYFLAEAMHASGVLAVVASGLYLSRKSVHFFSPGVRMQARAVWEALTFVLNGMIFVMIGVQLPDVLTKLHGYPTGWLLQMAAMFALLVIALRLIWVYPGAYLAWWIRTRIQKQKVDLPRPRYVFVVGWTGLRGVIALAAAMSLPHTLESGAPFPNRDLIVFLTFSVILVTLVVQGLSLPPLIRALGLQSTQLVDPEEFEARRAILEAALDRLEELRTRGEGHFADVYDDVAQHYRTRLATLSGEGADEHGSTADHARVYDDVSRELVSLERRIAVDLRNSGRISDEALRRVLYELDLDETRMTAADGVE